MQTIQFHQLPFMEKWRHDLKAHGTQYLGGAAVTLLLPGSPGKIILPTHNPDEEKVVRAAILISGHGVITIQDRRKKPQGTQDEQLFRRILCQQ